MLWKFHKKWEGEQLIVRNIFQWMISKIRSMHSRRYAETQLSISRISNTSSFYLQNKHEKQKEFINASIVQCVSANTCCVWSLWNGILNPGEGSFAGIRVPLVIIRRHEFSLTVKIHFSESLFKYSNKYTKCKAHSLKSYGGTCTIWTKSGCFFITPAKKTIV